MVYLVDDWQILKEYTWGRLGFYQLRGQEIRIITGELGFRREYSSTNDREFREIIAFCKINHLIQVDKYLSEDEFFR